MNSRRIAGALLALSTALTIGVASPAAAQSGGRYELEFEGPVMGGVTGVGATMSPAAGPLVIQLPAVVRSYPTVRFERAGALPDQPFQAAVGSASGQFAVRFTHPDLTGVYVGEAGAVRITEITDRVVRGEFAVIASPADSPGARTLTFRGRFEAPRR